jgi:ribonuclease-3
VALLKKKSNNTYILNKRDFRSRLRKILGFSPNNINIYEKALIHRSATFTKEDGTRINNERLEFLGDAILDAVLSDYLFNNFPDYDEGNLTKIRSKIVNGHMLNKLSVSLGIDSLIITHINNSNKGKKLYGDALEAFIGSVFIDKGYHKTKEFIIKRLVAEHIDLSSIMITENDYKSQVYQWAQKINKQIDISFTEEFDKSSNIILFTTTLRIDHEIFGHGTGSSKREAEQIASHAAWKKIQNIGYID